MSSDKILKRLKKNYSQNFWWLKILVKLGVPAFLEKKGITPQAIGVIFNPLTSNRERIQILKRTLPYFK